MTETTADDPGRADGDAAGPGRGPELVAEHRRLPAPGPAAPHQPGHRPDRAGAGPLRAHPGHVCPSCAERARTLRAAQCREGWHLEDEPDLDPDPATDEPGVLADPARRGPGRAATRPKRPGEDTTDLDELLGRAGRRRSPTRACAARSPPRATTGRQGEGRRSGPPGAARTPRTCPGARSTRARSARPTPRRTARPTGRRCSSP